MARGSYEAFSQRFKCEALEYLHPEELGFLGLSRLLLV